MLHAELILTEDERREIIRIDKLETFVNQVVDSVVAELGTDFVKTFTNEVGSVSLVLSKAGFKKKVEAAYDRIDDGLKDRIKRKMIARVDALVQERRDAQMV